MWGARGGRGIRQACLGQQACYAAQWSDCASGACTAAQAGAGQAPLLPKLPSQPASQPLSTHPLPPPGIARPAPLRRPRPTAARWCPSSTRSSQAGTW